MRIVRLGQDVDRTGRLADEALGRLFGAVDEYAAIIAAHDVATVRFVATSAVRDADNLDVFRDGIRERLGVDPEVVSGDEEAAALLRRSDPDPRRTPAGRGAGHRRWVDRADHRLAGARSRPPARSTSARCG